MQPIEFHSSVHYDFNRQQWLQNGLFGQKSIAEDKWVADEEYFLKYPILKDSRVSKMDLIFDFLFDFTDPGI